MRTRLLAIALLAVAGRSFAEPVLFDLPVPRWYGGSVQSAVTLDFDHDGDDDILIYGDPGGVGLSCKVLVNTDGTLLGLQPESVMEPIDLPDSSPDFLSVADFDADGAMDVKVGSLCVLTRGGGQFDLLRLPGVVGSKVVLLDTDSDGDRDFVVDGLIYMNDGTYSGVATTVPFPEFGTGFSDTIRLADGTEGCFYSVGESFRFLAPSPEANSLAVRELRYVSGPRGAYSVFHKTADLDGNGVREAIIVLQSDALNRVSIGPEGYTVHVLSDSFLATDIAAADLDGNGTQDLVARGPGAPLAWFDCSTGGEAVKTELPGGTTSGFILTPDLDSDGRPDIVTLTTGGLIRYWRNAGTFTPAPTPTPDPPPLPPEICPDLNGDRHIDAADLLLRQLSLPQ